MRHIIGLVVNPIAGMGGRVGLKGTDGKETVEQAKQLKAKPSAPDKTIEMLTRLREVEKNFTLLTYPCEMGEDEARGSGISPKVLGSITPSETTATDTKRAADEMAKLGVEILLFVGGDGTARDVFDAINGRIPVLGVPAGVKIYSSVFAINSRIAADIVGEFLRGGLIVREAEVMDIDEEAYRKGELSIKLYGYLLIPDEPLWIQRFKVATPFTEYESECVKSIAKAFFEEMESDYLYVIGPGTTTQALVDYVGLKKTLLGVDILNNRNLIAVDANEERILSMINEKKSKIVVTPIGGQGYIFGRGNQQISPAVISKVGKDNIIVVATDHKLRTLNPRRLLVDTGNAELDAELRGYIRVITGYREETIIRVE